MNKRVIVNKIVLYEPKNFKLYVHENKVNGKKYFGITKNPVLQRWEKRGSGYKRGTHIRNAFIRYGWDSFYHFVIMDGLTYEEALFYEKAFIEFYKTTNKKYGYNKDKGGKNFIVRSEIREELESKKFIKPVVHIDTRTVYSDSNMASYYTGYKASSIRRTCSSQKFMLFNSHWAFKEDYDKMTEYDIEKVLRMKPKHYMDDNRSVICLETLEVFKNAKCAQKDYNSTSVHCIQSCCKENNPNRLMAAKKHWMYYEDYLKATPDEIQARLSIRQGQKISKAVIKLETGEIFPSIEEASSATGLSSKTIRYSCTNKQQTHPRNGHWMFKKDYDVATPEEIHEKLYNSSKIKAWCRKRVKCVETGKIFECISDALVSLGVKGSTSSISKCCKNSNLTYKGFHWEFVTSEFDTPHPKQL